MDGPTPLGMNWSGGFTTDGRSAERNYADVMSLFKRSRISEFSKSRLSESPSYDRADFRRYSATDFSNEFVKVAKPDGIIVPNHMSGTQQNYSNEMSSIIDDGVHLDGKINLPTPDNTDARIRRDGIKVFKKNGY